jgi:hypothetical protein
MPWINNRVFNRTYTGYSNTKDITMDPNNNLWVAAANSAAPLRLYNPSSQIVDFITSDLVPYATGITMDPEGYLWVADPVNNKLYKVDLELSISDESSLELSDFSVRAGSNPFIGAVTLHIEGIESASVEILDIYGRLVVSGTTTGPWMWDGLINGTPAPSGAYLALIKNETGAVQTLNLIKL